MRCKVENAHHYYKAARRQVHRWRERGGAMLKVGVDFPDLCVALLVELVPEETTCK